MYSIPVDHFGEKIETWIQFSKSLFLDIRQLKPLQNYRNTNCIDFYENSNNNYNRFMN